MRKARHRSRTSAWRWSGCWIVRGDVGGKPGHEGLAVLDGRFPEAEKRADLGAVVLDGAAVPVIVRPFPRRDVGLAGDVLDGDAGDILPLPGKAKQCVALNAFARTRG
jgi:hypothetical protein